MPYARPEDGEYKLSVTFAPREDGGLRAYSRQLPEFVLSHRDAEAVMADVQPALRIILSAMFQTDVQHIEQVGDANDSEADEFESDVPVPVVTRTYVAHVS